MRNVLRKTCYLIVSALCIGVSDSAAQVITIGTGTSSTSTYNPVSVGGSTVAGHKNSRHQILYTAAQLNAAGITGPKMLDSIAWDVATVPSVALKNYSIKGKLYTPNSLNQYEGDGFTELAFRPAYMPATGYSWIAFSTPMYWNGVDNILLNICSDTVGVATSGKLRYTTYPSTGDNYWSYLSSAVPLCAATGITTNSFFQQPNIKMSFRAAIACSGVSSTLDISPAGTFTNCVGQTKLVQVASAVNSAVQYQWQQSVNGAAWSNVPVGGASLTSGTGPGYLAHFMGNVDSVTYRLQLTCGNSSVVSNTMVLKTNYTPVYATLPYSQDFESWMNGCNTTDAPDSSWLNDVDMGPLSFRREDEGASAGWTANVAPVYYNPPSITGSHSARVQTSKGPGVGGLNLYLNCFAAGNKEVRFDYQNKTGAANKLVVLYSTDAGSTFTSIDTFINQGVSGGWEPLIVQLPSTSSMTVLKFQAISIGSSSSGDFDLGIDNVRVLAPCNDTPVAGVVDGSGVCLGSNLTLGLVGGSAVAGLNWQWEYSTNGISWDTVPGGNVEHPVTVLNQATWFRCTVTCSNMGQSAMSAPQLISPNPSYMCYCISASTTVNPAFNLGNVKLSQANVLPALIDNGNPLPALNNSNCTEHYSDFSGLVPANIYRDSTYSLDLTYMSRSGSITKSYTKVYIDWNVNGSFDDPGEKVLSLNKAAGVFSTQGAIIVPATATIGITRMRIVTNDAVDTASWGPCSSYARGETEDYLLAVWQNACANGSVAGTVTASVDKSCPGYPITLTNIGYDSVSGMLTRIWQESADGTTWTDIVGSNQMNVYNTAFIATRKYRVKSICSAGGADSYSDTVSITQKTYCYCPSYADGGFSGLLDSSDIGGYTLRNITYPLVGGHLNNADAIQSFTDRTALLTDTFYVDSTYSFNLDHIILRNDHADAKVTMFIDYNGNGSYDIPAERVYSTFTTAVQWQKSGTITIPGNAVLNTKTGLRVVLNNDTAANAASDEACGVYTSGETEDYIVSFKKVPVGIEDMGNLAKGIHISPNPTTGQIVLAYSGEDIDNVMMEVTNITGAVLYKQSLKHLKKKEHVKLNLGGYSKGMYFINLKSANDKFTAKIVLQ